MCVLHNVCFVFLTLILLVFKIDFSGSKQNKKLIPVFSYYLPYHFNISAIFGQKFEDTMKYAQKQNRKVPYIIEECVEYIYKNGLETEGIFRYKT